MSEPTDPRQQFSSQELQRRTIVDPREIRTICGADAFYYHDGNRVLATASLLLANAASVLETRAYHGRFTFPYVSGIFFLHEGPFVVAAVRALSERPDLVCFDAHGMSHPRRLGLATICGMVLDIPSLGCAKSRLVGESRPYKDGLDMIVFDARAVGFVTRFEGVRRYWSPGFSMSMDELEGIIREHSEACIKSIAEADQVGRSSSYGGSKNNNDGKDDASSEALGR